MGGLYGDGSLTRHGYAIEEVLSGPMLCRRPEVAWQSLIELERACRGATPNRAHQVIAAMEDYFAAVWTLTQNVDGLHPRAGSLQFIDIYGDLHILTFTRCDFREEVEDIAHLELSPLCPRYGEIVRPDSVLFVSRSCRSRSWRS